MPPLAAAVAVYFAVSMATAYMIIAVGVVTLASIGMMAYTLATMPSAGGFAGEMKGRTQTVKSAVSPHRIIFGECMVGGTLVYYMKRQDDSSQAVYHYMVIALAGHQCEAIEDVYFGDALTSNTKFQTVIPAVPEEGYWGDDGAGNQTWIVTRPYQPESLKYHIQVTKYLGADSQAADPELIQYSDGQWTANHRLQEITYLVVRLEWDRNIFPNGIENIKAVVKGCNQITDPRNPGWTGYTNNWALCVRHYLLAQWGRNLSVADLDDAAFMVAATVSDEMVMYDTLPLYQYRYTCNGTITLDMTPVDIMQKLLSAGMGRLTEQQGQYRLKAGAYSSPVRPALTVDDLAGRLTIQTKQSKQNRFNGVKGTFADSRKYWQQTDFPLVKNDTYVAEDGEEIFKDIELPFTTDIYAAQRISKIILEKNRQGIVVDFPGKFTCFDISVGETIPLTIPHLGWVNKGFECIGWELAKDGQGVNLTLQEEAAGCYDWNMGMQTTVDPAPDTRLPDPWNVGAPFNIQATEELYSTNVRAVIKTRVVLSWSSLDHAAVEFEVRVNGAYHGKTIADAYTIDDVAVGVHEYSVRALNHLGVASTWTTQSFLIEGKTALPQPPTGVTATIEGDFVRITITPSDELDLSSISIVVGSSWDTGTNVGVVPIADSSSDVSYLWAPDRKGNLTFWAKAIDTSGGISLSATASNALNVDLPNVTGLVSFYQGTLAFLRWDLVVDPRQTTYEVRMGDAYEKALVLGVVTNNVFQAVGNGTYWVTARAKSASSAAPATLVIAGAALVKNVVAFHDESSWLGTLSGGAEIDIAGRVWLKNIGGVVQTPGYYTSSNIVDITSVQTCQLSANYQAFSDSPANMVDDMADFDAVTNFDGDYAGLSDVKIQVALSQDGSTWGDWLNFIPGPYTAQAFRFRAQLTSIDLAVTAVISALDFTIDVPDRTDLQTNVAIAAGGTAITYTKPFQVAPNVQVSILDASAGDTITFPVAPSATGLTVRIMNSGEGVARNINIFTQAY